MYINIFIFFMTWNIAVMEFTISAFDLQILYIIILFYSKKMIYTWVCNELPVLYWISP